VRGHRNEHQVDYFSHFYFYFYFFVIHPGGRDKAKMVTKALLHTLSLPAADGNYFLRPDRLLGAFVFSQQPVGHPEAKSALADERAADMATKERLGAVQRTMDASGGELRALHLELHKIPGSGADDTTVISLAADGDGEIELAATYGGDSSGGGDIGACRSPMADWRAGAETAFTSGGLDVTSSQTVLGGDDSPDEENKEDEEKSRRLRAAQQFRGSEVKLTNKGRSSTAGRHSLESGGDGNMKEEEQESGHRAADEAAAGPDVEKGDWKVITEVASGNPYFHNSVTGEMTWENPFEGICL